MNMKLRGLIAEIVGGAALVVISFTVSGCGSGDRSGDPAGEARASSLRTFWHHQRTAAGTVPALTPKPSGPQNYCPNPAVDFQEEVEGPAGRVDWLESGWTITAQRRVSSKASYDLRGGFVEFDVDLTNARGGVNTNLYLSFPHKPNCGLNCYCDSGATGGCAELDFIENNGDCYQATTYHVDANGNDKGGTQSGGSISPQVHVRAEWDSNGSLNVVVGGNHYSGPGLADQMEAWGAVLYSSQWTGWVPGNCPGDGNLQLASFTVKNLKIHGKVNQGPQPRLCTMAGQPDGLMFK